MVIGAGLWQIRGLGDLLAVEQAAQPLVQRLEPSQRVAVVMALLGIVIVGLFFVAIVLLGGNWARRLARHSPRRKPIDPSNGAPHPRNSPQAPLPHAKSDDTVEIKRSSGPTKIDQ